LGKVKKIISKVERSATIDEKVLGEIKEAFILWWCVINADLGKDLGEILDKMLSDKKLSVARKEQVKDFCISFKKPFEFQLEEENLKSINKIYNNKYKGKYVSFEKVSPGIKKLLIDHWQKFKHLTSYDIDTDYFTQKDFFKKLNEPTLEKRSLTKNLSSKIKSILGKSNLSLISLIKDHIFIDNYAADLGAKLDFLLLDHLSRKFGISAKELSWYSFGEIERLVKNATKLTSLELEARKKYRVMVQLDGNMEMFYGKSEFEKIKKLIEVSRLKPVTQLTGFTASRGLVQGRVKIVNGVNDIEKVLIGDILVATNTSPDLVMAIKRCIGIITDYGGITSHAAIISREFGIPCIVGTDIATQVLKDGNIVELDANKGVVRILSLR